MAKKVLLGDQEVMFAEAIKSVLEPNFEVVSIVSDGRSLVQAAQQFHPDVIVFDVVMPFQTGIETLRQLKKLSPPSKVLILTMVTDAATVNAALRYGADAYVLKSSMPFELDVAINTVLNGVTYIAPRLTNIIRKPVAYQERTRVAPRTLTPRESQVLKLIAEGRTSKEIGSILNISVKTVEFHRTNISNHLGIRSIAQLTRYAIEHGIIRT